MSHFSLHYHRSKLNLVDLAGSERVAKTGADGRILQEAKHINLSLHHLEHVIVTLQQQTGRQNHNPSTPPRLGTGISGKLSKESLHNRRSYTNSRGSDNYSSQTGLSSRHSLSSDGTRMLGRPSTRRGHVPYRNCMLTMVLKDSLGGNCLTAMIATISAEESNIHETISTCRFSQRVACICNRARRNEELDDKVVIRKLKQRVAELEAEILSLKDTSQLSVTPQSSCVTSPVPERSSSFCRPLNDSDRQRCHEILHGFFHGKIDNPVTAGIDSAAMFQECLNVLRTIVLHSLGIGTPQTAETARHLTEQISTITYPASSRAHSIPTQTKKAMTESSHTATPIISVAPRDKRSKVYVTPSPNSRISSGFGSLHDEDGSITCESSYDNVKQMSQAQNSGTRARDHQRDPNLIAIEQRATERERKKRKRHKHHRHSRSHDTPSSSDRQTDYTVSTVSPTYDKEISRVEIHQRESNPPPPIGAWVTPVTGNTAGQTGVVRSRHEDTRSGQREQSLESASNTPSYPTLPLNTTSVIVSPRYDRNSKANTSAGGVESDHSEEDMISPRKSTAFSQRAEKQRKKLHSKQVELLKFKEEKQRLASEVNLLNLKVLEEGTKDELSHIGEQLAAQHSQYHQLQKSGANPEHICAEKIAEQQLRIKQAKLHQKLMDVQYQLRMSGEEITVVNSSIDRAKHTISPKQTISPLSSQAGSADSHYGHAANVWKLPTQQVQNEILKHEVRQSKVQEQIERLRISQIEKQLQLKEASTRRKILALKQQLLGGNRPPATAPAKPPSHTTSPPSVPVPSSKSDHVVNLNSQNLIRTEELSHFIHSPVQSLHEPHVRNTSSYVKSSSKEATTDSALPQRILSERVKPSMPIQISSEASTAAKTDNGNKTTEAMSQSERIKPSTPTKIKKVGLTSEIVSGNKPSTTATGNSESTIMTDQAKHQGTGKVSSTPPRTKVPRQKLTLPEEIKETEYMSALQRQKARVSRIRRCIVAATVIQRAWRDCRDHRVTQ